MAKDVGNRNTIREIEEARQSGTLELNLSSRKLTSLPLSLGQLTQLQSLNLSDNGLTALPDWLGQLTHLRLLNLSDNGLTSLPKRLGQLTQLRSLVISDNELTELPEWLAQVAQLESLYVAGNKLTSLPEWLGQLTQLKTLDIAGNKLTALPEWLGQLTQLELLDIAGNKLTALPESLGELLRLQSLDLSKNELNKLPESLGKLTQLRSLKLSQNDLTALPESLGGLTQLHALEVSRNRLTQLPESLGLLVSLKSLGLWDNALRNLPDSIGSLQSLRTLLIPINQITEFPESAAQLQSLEVLDFGHIDALKSAELGDIPNSFTANRVSAGNPLKYVPEWVRELSKLASLGLDDCGLTSVPEWIAELTNLTTLELRNNELTTIPLSLSKLRELKVLGLNGNPLNPELAAASEEGFEAVKRYLLANAEAQVVLNESKLILVGEGEVGKSCLLGALRGDPWEEGRPTTHGIEIKPVKVTDPDTGTEIILNGWDFGGQRVYRPTHQLFFSAPAVYLVAWKPREGSQQGFVKEWIKLVKHREPDAKILVVATHGGPGARQPDIDRQEIWDQFGKETVIDFFHVDSRPPRIDKNTKKRVGTGAGIKKLRSAIARVAAGLPEMGRTFPANWQKARTALRNCDEAYLPLDRVFDICKGQDVEEEDARLLLRICRRVGDLIHFEHDPILSDIVILKPDWLATAISFVLDDEQTREKGHGLVNFSRLGRIWNDPKKKKADRYPTRLQHVFLRLMERFDLSYRVAELGKGEEDGTSLIAQLVPDIRPDVIPGWGPSPSNGDTQQVQICRIVDTKKNQPANAEGLFYQLIVRLHKFSLGRADYSNSIHWQRGLVLEDDTGARAFLEHLGNNVRITVRSPYPERFLSALTYEVKWLVESFWEGLRCEVTVPCLTVLSDYTACIGLFEVTKLIENKRRGRNEVPCTICNEWHMIESLLHNAPAAQPNPLDELLARFDGMMTRIAAIRVQVSQQHAEVLGRFDGVDAKDREIVSKIEAAYTRLMRTLLDEAKEGPRLFSLEPVEPGFFDRPKWMSAKFKLTLWCEHSREPLHKLAGNEDQGVYTIDLPREWLVKAAPFLKVLSSTLGLVFPIVAAGAKVALPEADFKSIEAQLALGKATAESLLKGGDQVGQWMAKDDGLELEPGTTIRAEGASLRQLHAWLKGKDPGFGGLVRVSNRRQEFLWVHPQFVKEY